MTKFYQSNLTYCTAAALHWHMTSPQTLVEEPWSPPSVPYPLDLSAIPFGPVAGVSKPPPNEGLVLFRPVLPSPGVEVFSVFSSDQRKKLQPPDWHLKNWRPVDRSCKENQDLFLIPVSKEFPSFSGQ